MKILCVGKNYARHAREMGGDTPTSPVWFWKPESAIIRDGEAVVLAPGIGSVHHEVELAIRIGAHCKDLPDAEAGRAAVAAFTVAVDVTARDLQAEAKKAGRPWAQAKGFDTFLPLSAWQDATGVDLQDLRLRLSLDDDVKQEGTTADMTWDVGTLVRLASQWTTLEAGDILLTGTPEGVGPLADGQTMEAEVVGHVRSAWPVRAG